MNAIKKWAQINPKAYTTPEGQGLKRGDRKAYKKEIDERVGSIFKNHRTAIAVSVLLTSPIFFLAWPLGYLAIREGAKLEVDAARAYEKLSFIETLCEKLNEGDKSHEDAFKEARNMHPQLQAIIPEKNRLALTFMALKLNDKEFKEKYATKDTRKKWQALVEESKKDEDSICKMAGLIGLKTSLEDLINWAKEQQVKSLGENAIISPLRKLMQNNYDVWREYSPNKDELTNENILKELVKKYEIDVQQLNFITKQIMSIDSTIETSSAARRKILKLLQNKPADDSADKKLLDTVLFLRIAFSQNKEKSKILDDVNINSLAIFNNIKNDKYKKYRNLAEGSNDILWITERDAKSGRPPYIINKKIKDEELKIFLKEDGIHKQSTIETTKISNKEKSDYMQPLFTFIESISGLSEEKSTELKYQAQLAMSQYYQTPVMEAICLKFVERHPKYQIKENYFYIDSNSTLEPINDKPFIINYNEETRKMDVIIHNDYNIKVFENGIPQERNLRIKSTAQFAFNLNAENLNPKLETINLDTKIKCDNPTLDDISEKDKINIPSDQDSNREI